MDKPKYTPGPWKFEIEGLVWVVCADAEPLVAAAYNEANAHIISAAPDMYEALVQMRAAMDEALREWLGKKGPAADWGIINDALCNSANALRKARGQ